jgi:RNA polymerase sigma-70 factor, ECF subfamily
VLFFTLPAQPFTGSDFLDRLRRRDPDTLHRLMGEYLPQVYRAARGAGLGVQDAEDAAQSTFVTFMEKVHEFEGRSHVRTWLFGILYRKISESRRALQREENAQDIEDVMEKRFKTNGFWATPPRESDSETFDREIRLHLEECLEGVATDQRLAFVLREVEELDSEEICETMGIERSNLGVLLFRGRNKLRECLESRNIAPEGKG